MFWDINIDWYLKLKERLKSVWAEGHVIITTSISMHHMQCFGPVLDVLGGYRWKLEAEVIKQCGGLPLAMETLTEINGGPGPGSEGVMSRHFWHFSV